MPSTRSTLGFKAPLFMKINFPFNYKNLFQSFIICSIIILIVACNGTKQDESANTEGQPVVIGDTAIRIDNYLKKLETEEGFSGGLLIIKNGKKVFSKGYGWANKEKQIPFTTTSLACIGSITKYFTATAFLKLCELDNKISVNDSLRKFFPLVPSDKADITIHQLLTHSSGFHEFLENDGGDYAKIETKDFLTSAFKEPLAFAPGTKAVYTNVGMSILAIILEQVTGMSYESFLQKYLFDSAGIKTMGYNYPVKNDSALAHGYDNGKDWGTLQSHYDAAGGGPYWNLKGNGGQYASLEDWYEWIVSVDEGKILNQSSLEKMFSPQIVEEGMDGKFSFGYGCNIYQSRRNTKAIDNGGSNGIYFARLLRLPEDGVVFYLVTNNNIMNANMVLPNVTQLFFDGEIKQDATQQLRGFDSPKAEEIYNLLKEKGAADFENELSKAGITVDDDMIYLEAGQKLLEEKKADEAIALYKVYTKQFPNIIVAWNDLGDAYVLKGEKENAINCYRQALKLRPENPRAKEALEKLK